MAVGPTRSAFAAVLLASHLLDACAAPSRGTFRDIPEAPQMKIVPAGQFLMGASAAEAIREGRRAETAAWERPQHVVRLTKPLAVSVGHVTRAEFAAFVRATNREMSGCMVRDGTWQFEPQRSFSDTAAVQSDTDPVVCVSPADAEAYAAWLSARTGHHYRLLHEAEWEYAARGGTRTARWWGDGRTGMCGYANGADQAFERRYPGEPGVNTSCDDGFVQSNPRDAYPPNPFGLRNMLGNAWQWTADCFVETYAQAPTDAQVPLPGGDCAKRAIRGGSWHNPPDALRAAARFWLPVSMRSSSVGFRLAREIDR